MSRSDRRPGGYGATDDDRNDATKRHATPGIASRLARQIIAGFLTLS
jgi:hypothetical protein